MQVDTFKWMRSFSKELRHVNNLFYRYGLKGNLPDYYEIKLIDGRLKIVLVNKEAFPEHIAEALYIAFNNALSKS